MELKLNTFKNEKVQSIEKDNLLMTQTIYFENKAILNIQTDMPIAKINTFFLEFCALMGFLFFLWVIFVNNLLKGYSEYVHNISLIEEYDEGENCKEIPNVFYSYFCCCGKNKRLYRKSMVILADATNPLNLLT